MTLIKLSYCYQRKECISTMPKRRLPPIHLVDERLDTLSVGHAGTGTISVLFEIIFRNAGHMSIMVCVNRILIAVLNHILHCTSWWSIHILDSMRRSAISRKENSSLHHFCPLSTYNARPKTNRHFCRADEDASLSTGSGARGKNCTRALILISHLPLPGDRINQRTYDFKYPTKERASPLECVTERLITISITS